MNDQIELRLLGRLWIRLANGQVVPAPHWASDKTTDLLRLLALRSGQIVSSASLIEKLWPAATPSAATSSLHAATMQIRKVLGKNSIMRHLTGLQLQGIWVDVTAHHELGLEISGALHTRQFARVVAAAKQAEALYIDDFHACDDESDWARDIREELRAQRKLMLVDAAESAIELGWLRDAIEMSILAIGLDSCFEPAHQALMRAYAGIGETGSATRTYERCRRNLKTVLGVEPSPATEAMHLLLTSPVPETAKLPDDGAWPNQVHVIESPLLDQRELDELALTVLGAPPCPELAATLKMRSGCRAGVAVDVLRDWVSKGQVISTLRGLALVSDALTSTVLPTASVTFRVLMAQLEPTELEICQLMAVLDRPVSATDVMDLLGSQRRTEQRRIEIEACMDRLTRRGIFQASEDTYAFRDRTTQDLFELWLRPSLQVRITQRIDEQGILLTQSG